MNLRRYRLSVICQSALRNVARPAGLEPATPGLEGRCSIQLSYGRVPAMLPTATCCCHGQLLLSASRLARRCNARVASSLQAIPGNRALRIRHESLQQHTRRPSRPLDSLLSTRVHPLPRASGSPRAIDIESAWP